MVGLAAEQELDVGADPGDAADLHGLGVPQCPEGGVLDASLKQALQEDGAVAGGAGAGVVGGIGEDGRAVGGFGRTGWGSGWGAGGGGGDGQGLVDGGAADHELVAAGPGERG